MVTAVYGGYEHHTQCLVVNQTASQSSALEIINCHDVAQCYYGPCGFNLGPCCQNGQECSMEKLFTTKLSLILEYSGVTTDSEVVIKQRGNFTPEREWVPKVGQYFDCFYHYNFDYSISLHSYYNDRKGPVGGFIFLGSFCLSAGIVLFGTIWECYEREHSSPPQNDEEQPIQQQEGQQIPVYGGTPSILEEEGHTQVQMESSV